LSNRLKFSDSPSAESPCHGVRDPPSTFIFLVSEKVVFQKRHLPGQNRSGKKGGNSTGDGGNGGNCTGVAGWNTGALFLSRSTEPTKPLPIPNILHDFFLKQGTLVDALMESQSTSSVPTSVMDQSPPPGTPTLIPPPSSLNSPTFSIGLLTTSTTNSPISSSLMSLFDGGVVHSTRV
jgi:hypothetical protein